MELLTLSALQARKKALQAVYIQMRLLVRSNLNRICPVCLFYLATILSGIEFFLRDIPFYLAWTKSRKRYCTIPGVASALASASTFTLMKVFKELIFSRPFDSLIYIWYDDRYYSKVLFSNTPSPLPQDQGQVKVMNLEIFNDKDF